MKGENFYDLNLKIAAQFKIDFDKEGKVGTVGFECPSKNPKEMEDFAKAFINSGVRVSGDIPQDPKFWQQFRQEYLSDSKHSAQEWDKLTSNLPDELIGRPKTNTQSNSATANPLNKSKPQNQPGGLIANLLKPNQPQQTDAENLTPPRPTRKPSKKEIKKMRREGFNPRDPEQVARYMQQQKRKQGQDKNNTAANNMPPRDNDYGR